MLIVTSILSIVKLSVAIVECCHAECRYVEYHYAECPLLNVATLSIIC
jgi:hypothetical protein